MWLFITEVFVVGQSKEDIFGCKGLKNVAMATNVWPKWAKISHNGHNFSYMRHIHAEFGFETRFVLSGNSSVTIPYKRTKQRYYGNQFWD